MNVPAIVAGTVALACAGVAGYFADRWSAEHARVAELELRLAQESRAPRTQPTLAAHAETALLDTALPRGAHAGGLESRGFVDTPGIEDFLARARAKSAERARRLREDPEYRAALLARFKLGAQRANEGLEDELGLSPAEANAFFTLLAEEQLRLQEDATLRSAIEADPRASAPAMQERLRALERESEVRLRAQLGDARFKDWQEFQRSAPARAEAREIRDALAYTSAPLRPEQERRLAAAFAREIDADREWYESQRERFAAIEPGTASPELAKLNEEWRARREATHGRLHAAAREALAAPQLARFDELLAQRFLLERAEADVANGEAAPFVVGPGMTWVGWAGSIDD